MEKFVSKLEKYVGPIANKIESQRHISTIKNGMISLMAVLMVGSIGMIVSGIGTFFPADSAVGTFFSEYSAILNIPFQFTYGVLSIYAAISIAFYHAKQLDIPPFHCIIAGVSATLVLNTKVVDGVLDTAFLDSRGLFVAIFASLLAVEFMNFAVKKKLTIRIKGLPDMISKTFESIVPLLLVIVVSAVISQLSISLTDGQIIPELFTTMLAPAVTGIDSAWGVFAVVFLEMLFWFFGLNGYAILVGFTLPFMTQYVAANAAAFQAGAEVLPHVFTEAWWGTVAAATGSGVTGAIAILGLRSKSKQLNAAGKASIVPAIFNISEPVVYGFPVAFNPYFFIPFVIGTPLLSVFSYFIFRLGFIRPPVAQVGGMPTPIAQYLITLDWKAPIYAILVIAAAVVMYYPFFKMYEKSVLEKEKELAKKDERNFDDDLDFDLDF
ncbi:PTS transporter subunit EIIC [Clostridium tertium]|nr:MULTISPECIES: PTS transporter subunit EIIC [Clostridium]MBS4958671.1 PTS sugar transporter subunit IIC [Clostridium sp.]MDB1921629.1 PTS transporter subunit EIIC [Clostridium tertium]MDB1924833.1 PTS transporter subunit EIIC [Clostridium tertium]MDB1930560.1 PTS transporter subunit EIIC [Clostridium tertium]MDU2155983.1 PTS transporter subunit EIIC [Clostridium sp.]